MKFVVLLSGGKDSCFNAIKCIKHGHELVCLANLAPPELYEGEDMNSFMYQTAGHTAVPELANCFGVPLVRQIIHGTAVTQRLDYLTEVEQDEVEDLYVLLRTVKERFPDVEGVSCGAIVSTYQRLRVENICQRLGLTVLSYLWMRDRRALLQEMVQAGLEAVLVKVAGAGLDPHRHLGKSLSVLQPTLLRLHNQYGLDVCGEGGEYESLVLDCSLFRKRLQLVDTEIVIDEENYTVGYLKIKSCCCLEKDGAGVVPAAESADATLLHALHPILQQAAPLSLAAPSDLQGSAFTQRKVFAAAGTGQVASSGVSNCSGAEAFPKPTVVIGSDGFGQTSLVCPVVTTVDGEDGTTSAEQVQGQLRNIFERLRAALEDAGVSLQDTVFVHLYIRSSAIFKAVNDEYCKWFGHYPPSRSCVCVSVPATDTCSVR
jgi:diphthine-ammonia ligase